MNHTFTTQLMQWHRHHNRREMPWKGERDPYRIWLSEIILQQTRVAQGWAYYERFLARYPDVRSLAAAADQEVFKLWEGLGYYSRCRNLLVTARTIVSQYQGEFPREYAQILALRGIGAYTAAAIASFAFDLPYPVVDGNVIRVLARVKGLEEPVDQPAVRKQIEQLAALYLDRQHPAAYNQAMMDFGATVCTPRSPQCSSCPLSGICLALKNEKVQEIPLKKAKPGKRKRWIYYLMVEARGKILVRERREKDIWQHLFELVRLESPQPLAETALRAHPDFMAWLPPGALNDVRISTALSQQLTHQEIRGQFIHLRLSRKPARSPEGYHWVDREAFHQLAFPRMIRSWLQQEGILS